MRVGPQRSWQRPAGGFRCWVRTQRSSPSRYIESEQAKCPKGASYAPRPALAGPAWPGARCLAAVAAGSMAAGSIDVLAIRDLWNGGSMNKMAVRNVLGCRSGDLAART